MINDNGIIKSSDDKIFGSANRAFKYGDSVFETIRCIGGQPSYWEDHYFRLMAGMRILRMDIPDAFTPEYLKEQITALLAASQLSAGEARVRLSVYRKDGGQYVPKDNSVGFVIEASALETGAFCKSPEEYTIDLFKDFYVQKGLLSNIKSGNRLLNVVAGVFQDENKLDNCVLINDDKGVAEVINGNIFLIKGNKLITPAPEEGCLKGIARKNIIDLVQKEGVFELEERKVSPFELQKADEVFITNSIQGIVSVSQYRKKTFAKVLTRKLAFKYILMSNSSVDSQVH